MEHHPDDILSAFLFTNSTLGPRKTEQVVFMNPGHNNNADNFLRNTNQLDQQISRVYSDPNVVSTLAQRHAEDLGHTVDPSLAKSRFMMPNQNNEIRGEAASMRNECQSYHASPGHEHQNMSRSGSRKRRRTSPDQLQFLETLYMSTPTPALSERIEVGRKVGMTPREVQIWFQNRRAKTRQMEKRRSSGSPLERVSYYGGPEKQSPVSFPMPHLLAQIADPLTNQMGRLAEHDALHLTKLTCGSWTNLQPYELFADFINRKFVILLELSGRKHVIQLPYRIIHFISVTYTDSTCSLQFTLNGVPEFAIETQIHEQLSWYSCRDFTPGHQASQFLKPALLGRTADVLKKFESIVNKDVFLMSVVRFRDRSLPNTTGADPRLDTPQITQNTQNTFDTHDTQAQSHQSDQLDTHAMTPLSAMPATSVSSWAPSFHGNNIGSDLNAHVAPVDMGPVTPKSPVPQTVGAPSESIDDFLKSLAPDIPKSVFNSQAASRIPSPEAQSGELSLAWFQQMNGTI